MKVEIKESDKVIDEEGNHVGTVLKKGFGKMTIYCFLCKETVSSLKHYEDQH